MNLLQSSWGRKWNMLALKSAFSMASRLPGGGGEVLKQKKREGEAPRPVLVSLDSKFLMKARMRIDCVDQDLVDLAARNTAGGLFQKLQKLTCTKTSDMLSSIWTAEMFEYKCFLYLIEV